jgi:hypothetical protein
VKTYGLSPQDTFNLLDQISSGSSDPDYTLMVVLNNLQMQTGGMDTPRDEITTILQNFASDDMAGDPNFNVGFQNALNFLSGR